MIGLSNYGSGGNVVMDHFRSCGLAVRAVGGRNRRLCKWCDSAGAAATVEQEALQVVLVGLLADHRADWCWCATVSLRITPFASFVL